MDFFFHSCDGVFLLVTRWICNFRHVQLYFFKLTIKNVAVAFVCHFGEMKESIRKKHTTYFIYNVYFKLTHESEHCLQMNLWVIFVSCQVWQLLQLSAAHFYEISNQIYQFTLNLLFTKSLNHVAYDDRDTESGCPSSFYAFIIQQLNIMMKSRWIWFELDLVGGNVHTFSWKS